MKVRETRSAGLGILIISFEIKMATCFVVSFTGIETADM